MSTQLGISYETVVSFFEATEGNYRNAIYITCENCEYQKESCCGDFLFIPGHDCRPVLLPISDARTLLGAAFDKTDCISIMPAKTFLRLYQQWIQISTTSDDLCPLQQLLVLMNC